MLMETINCIINFFAGCSLKFRYEKYGMCVKGFHKMKIGNIIILMLVLHILLMACKYDLINKKEKIDMT